MVTEISLTIGEKRQKKKSEKIHSEKALINWGTSFVNVKYFWIILFFILILEMLTKEMYVMSCAMVEMQ